MSQLLSQIVQYSVSVPTTNAHILWQISLRKQKEVEMDDLSDDESQHSDTNQADVTQLSTGYLHLDRPLVSSYSLFPTWRALWKKHALAPWRAISAHFALDVTNNVSLIYIPNTCDSYVDCNQPDFSPADWHAVPR